MDWRDILRRIKAGECVQDVLEEYMGTDRERFRAYLDNIGPEGAAALRSYDAAMRDIDLGLTGARNAWHSLSDKQRDVLSAISRTHTGCIVRRSFKPSVYVLNGQSDLLCRVATVRCLIAHDLLACDGGTFDPEQTAVITERGKFVVYHGGKTKTQEAPM